MEAIIIVDNRVRILVEGLPPEVLGDIRQKFEHENAKHAAMLRMFPKMSRGYVAKLEPPVIRTWREDRGWLTVPRGGMGRVREVLRGYGISWSVQDHREKGRGDGRVPGHLVQLWEHQRDIVKAAIAREQCIIRSGTGSGKTSALFALAARLKVPTLVLVHSGALFDQWIERAEVELGVPRDKVGRVRGQVKKLAPLTIGMQRTVVKRVREREFREYFGAVFADEVHMFAAPTIFACVDPMPARYRIGASADERRKDKKEFLIHDLFGSVAIDIKRDDLVDAGHIVDVEVRVVPTRFRADWYGLPDGDEKHIDFVRLIEEMSADAERNQIIAEIAQQELSSGSQVLAMTHRREHCSGLARFIAKLTGTQVGVLMGGEEGSKELRGSIAAMREGELRAGVGTYQAVGTGVDLPSVDVGIACTPIASNEQFFGQVRGRFCRTSEGKTEGRLYVLLDVNVYPHHLANLIRWNRRVVVADEGEWIDARQYSKRLKSA